MAKKKSKPIDQQMEIETPVVEPELPEQQPETKTGTVCKCQYLNVRKEPKADSKVVAMIAADTVVEITDERFGFYGVTTPEGIKGFCMKKFIAIP